MLLQVQASQVSTTINKSMIPIHGKYVAVILNTSLQANVITNQLRITTNPIQERAVECSIGSTNFVIIDLMPHIGSGNAIASTVTPKRECKSFDRPIARYVEMMLICPTTITLSSDGLKSLLDTATRIIAPKPDMH